MTSRSVFGTLLIAAGLGLLLDRAGFMDFGALLATWWPLILILIGAVQLATRSAPQVGSFILLAIGLFFQAQTLDLLPANAWSYVWPVLLVLVGVWLLAARSIRPSTQLATDDHIRSFVAFGGANPRSESDSFRGGSITTLFGGTEIDLRGAQLAAEGAELEVTVLFGGAEITVPTDWQVQMSGLPILGGWENKTRLKSAEGEGAPIGKLKVNCFVAFGGIEVHN